ncbi:HNH endonuclease signature motif containing protein, partial [Leucobacter sp. M11]|uniref:HNH endonuclease signature motif containing protein n=1 Tax=Leucobacter sp. M11 TaxID=2993565 RepID=UPI002D80F88A
DVADPEAGTLTHTGVRFEPVTGADTKGPSGTSTDPTPDDRTPAQRTLDRLIDGIRAHLAERNAGVATGASTLVNIHVSAESLQDGTGPAWADGIFAPLSAETALRELCDGKHAITIFGTTGAVLAQGRAQRLFTPAQKLALAARDGGCVWPGCDAPPTDCDAHHVIPWSEHNLNGPTDVKNGVLLCRFHHRRIHEHARDGLGAEHRWTIRMIRELPHLIPPERLDWNRTPRPLGRRRTGVRHRTRGRSPARDHAR